MVEAASWDEVRGRLRFGQRLTGTVVRVPRPGAIGIMVDVGLPVGGFVDVLLLPLDESQWPAEGTTAEFEVWWADRRPQVRLKPVEARYLREDFPAWVRRWRPSWTAEVGSPLSDG